MKLLLLLLFVGCVSAAFNEVAERATKDAVQNFLMGMEEAQALHEALGIEQNAELERFERDIKDELAKYLKEAIQRTLKKIEEAGKALSPDILSKLHHLKKKIAEIQIEDDEIEGFKEKLDQQLNKILEETGILYKRSADIDETMESMIGDINFKSMFLKLKEMILEKMNVSSVRASLEKIVGQGSQKLCEWLTNKGKEKLLGFFDRVLESDTKSKRSIFDLYDHLRDYFKDLDQEFKAKFGNFEEWLKNVVQKGLDKTKLTVEDIRRIAEELMKKSKDVGEEAAAEMFCYLRSHKDKFGDLYYEVRDKVMRKVFSSSASSH